MLHSTLSRVARGAGELDHQTSLEHTVTTVDAQLLNTVVMVLALGVIAGEFCDLRRDGVLRTPC